MEEQNNNGQLQIELREEVAQGNKSSNCGKTTICRSYDKRKNSKTR